MNIKIYNISIRLAYVQPRVLFVWTFLMLSKLVRFECNYIYVDCGVKLNIQCHFWNHLNQCVHICARTRQVPWRNFCSGNGHFVSLKEKFEMNNLARPVNKDCFWPVYHLWKCRNALDIWLKLSWKQIRIISTLIWQFLKLHKTIRCSDAKLYLKIFPKSLSVKNLF